MFPYFTVFGKNIAYYGILMILGFLVAGASTFLRAGKRGTTRTDAVYAAVFATGGGILGAKLLAVLTTLPYLIDGTASFMDLLTGGFVFYGGLLGGVGGLYLYLKIYKLDVVRYFDLFAVCVPLGHALGRVGCFFAGCCYGIPCDCAISVTYSEVYAQYGTPVGVKLLPVQLIEGAFLLLLYVALEIVYRKTQRAGISLLVYITAYAVARFVLEFFRGDSVRGLLFALSTSQWISLGLLVLVYAAVIVRCVKGRKKPSDIRSSL